MGYNTDFDGVINFSRELTVSELRIITEILKDSEADKLASATGYTPKSDDRYSYTNLEVNDDYTGIKWNGNEKTYYMVTSLNVVFHAIRQQIPDLSFNGRMEAQGEDRRDVWAIEVTDGVAQRVDVPKPHMTQCPSCDEWFETVRAKTSADWKEVRLRDAAPDLLAACKAFLHADGEGRYSASEVYEAREMMKAAIAKAEGRG